MQANFFVTADYPFLGDGVGEKGGMDYEGAWGTFGG